MIRPHRVWWTYGQAAHLVWVLDSGCTSFSKDDKNYEITLCGETVLYSVSRIPARLCMKCHDLSVRLKLMEELSE